MNAIAVRGMGQSNAVAASRLRLAALVLLGLCGSPSFALESDLPVVVAQAGLAMPGERPRPQLEVTATTLPRFDSVDNANSSSRLDMTWLPPRRSAVGIARILAGVP